MRSFALNRFYNTDFFSGLGDDTLVALLSPVSERLAQSRIFLDNIPTDADERRILCERIATIAGDVDHGFSRSFQLELKAISDIAQLEDLADIHAAALEHPDPEPFLIQCEPTANELAILLWRWNSEFVERITAGRPPKASTFYVFQSNGNVPQYTPPSQAVIDRIKQELGGWFNAHKRGNSCIVRFHDTDEEVMIVIGHADLPKYLEKLSGTEVQRDLLRLHDYDLLVFRKDTGDLQVYQSRPSIRMMKTFHKVIGREVFGRENQFVDKRLTLDPLMTSKEEALVCGDFPMIKSVSLSHLRVSSVTGSRASTSHTAKDIFSQTSTDPALNAYLFGVNRKPDAAWFSVSIEGLNKDLNVRVTLPQKVTVSRPEYMPMIHRWLQARGFFGTPEPQDDVEALDPEPCVAGV